MSQSYFLFYFVGSLLMFHVLIYTSCLCFFFAHFFPVHLCFICYLSLFPPQLFIKCHVCQDMISCGITIMICQTNRAFQCHQTSLCSTTSGQKFQRIPFNLINLKLLSECVKPALYSSNYMNIVYFLTSRSLM